MKKVSLNKKENMKNIEKKLNELFNFFKDEKNIIIFYTNLAEYLKYIKNSKILTTISNSLEEEIRGKFKELSLEEPINSNEKRLLTKKFQDERRRSLWGAWERLLWAHSALNEFGDMPTYEMPPKKKLGKERFYFSITNDYTHFYFEIDKIMGHKNLSEHIHNQVNSEIGVPINTIANKQDDPNYFEFFKDYAKKTHAYFLTELNVKKENSKQIKNEDNKKVLITIKKKDKDKYLITVNKKERVIVGSNRSDGKMWCMLYEIAENDIVSLENHQCGNGEEYLSFVKNINNPKKNSLKKFLEDQGIFSNILEKDGNYAKSSDFFDIKKC